MTPLLLILAALPSLLATPCPCSDIYSYVHSSCYNTAPKPCTMNLGGRKPKSLLTVKVQKRGSFVSTCHKPNGRNICFYPITHWGYSDGGRVLDQNREKKQEQVIKNIISRLQATSESPSPHIAIPLPSTCLSQGNYTSRPRQKLHNSGPVSDKVLFSASSNLTCINHSSPNYTGLTNSAPSFCSTWVLWNSTNNCTNRKSSFSVGPVHMHVSSLNHLDLASWSS